jgi:hypothetical protein
MKGKDECGTLRRERSSSTSKNSRTWRGSAFSTKLVSNIERIDRIEKILAVVKGTQDGEARAAARLVLRLCETYGISLEQLRGPSGGPVDDLIDKVEQLTRSGASAQNDADLGSEHSLTNNSSASGMRLHYEFRRVQAFEDHNGREWGAA